MSNSLSSHIDMLQETMLESMVNFFIKDLKGTYLCLNKKLITYSNLNDVSDLIGKTDRTLTQHKFALKIRENDQTVITHKKPVQLIEYGGTCDDKVFFFISHKKPFYYNNKLVGVYGTSLEIPVGELHSSTPLSDKTEFYDTQKNKLLQATPSKKRVLYWHLKGYTIPEIAEKLGLSKRTVEHYLAFIKDENGYTSVREMLLYVRAI